MELGLHRLRMLRELAQRGSVTAAAAALRYTPSAVSQQLIRLERDVGAKLVEPAGRGLRLTEIGRVLAAHAEEILAAEERARTAVERARTELVADVNVGVLATVAAALLPPILADLAARHPGLRVRTREIDPEDALVAVRRGDLDLAFVLDYPDAPMPWGEEPHPIPVGFDRLRLAVPGTVDQPVEPVPLTDLAERPWILSGPGTHFGRAVRAACRRAGFAPRVVHEVDEPATALAMVAGGLGVSIVAELGLVFRPDGVTIAPLVEPLQRRVMVTHRSTTTDRPAIRAFLEATVTAARTLRLPTTPDTGG